MYAEELIDSTYGNTIIDPITNAPERSIITNPPYSNDIEDYIIEQVDNSNLVGMVESTHGVEIVGYGDFEYHWYPRGYKSRETICDAFQYEEGKWFKIHDDRDFTCILMLRDTAKGSSIDEDFEVFGGKLEMPNWNFSFNSKRGTLICFPSCPRFLHRISEVELGEQNFIKFRLKAKEQYIMNVNDFSGNPSTWFNF